MRGPSASMDRRAPYSLAKVRVDRRWLVNGELLDESPDRGNNNCVMVSPKELLRWQTVIYHCDKNVGLVAC
jgi:hypothetical protein